MPNGVAEVGAVGKFRKPLLYIFFTFENSISRKKYLSDNLGILIENLAMPDGRVIICGGSLLELMPGGKYGARNMTKCWSWIHRTDKIEPLEFLSKLPFNWLGPFLPNLMQLVKFENQNEMNNISEENVSKHQENITATNIELSTMNRNEYYR